MQTLPPAFADIFRGLNARNTVALFSRQCRSLPEAWFARQPQNLSTVNNQHDTQLLGWTSASVVGSPSNSASFGHSSAVGTASSRSKAGMRVCVTASKAASSRCFKPRSRRWIWMTSPSVFGSKGNAFHGRSRPLSGIRSTRITRCVIPNSAIDCSDVQSS